MPGLGPTVASLTLKGTALEVRVEPADADHAAVVAARLPELAASLEALGLRAAATAGVARAAALEGGRQGETLSGAGLALWA